jgi:tRNA C32,U32 (ribose-2'-O)-methylase TrmJ
METPAVLIDPKYPCNVGAAIRACSCFEVDSLDRTARESAKYERLPHEERARSE